MLPQDTLDVDTQLGADVVADGPIDRYVLADCFDEFAGNLAA